MNMFALCAFGLLVFAPACCGKKNCKVTEVEKTEVIQEKVVENTPAQAQPKQIKF
jgi:hypothetical protein